jgi:phosphoglucosamine mutase
MLADNHVLGGEQSGHIIMRHYANTGDGLLTALHLMQALKTSGKKLSELSKVMVRYPQELINVNKVVKEKLATSAKLQSFIAQKQKQLAGAGRILVRASGTENLVRVMVEAESGPIAEQIAEEIAALVRSELS